MKDLMLGTVSYQTNTIKGGVRVNLISSGSPFAEISGETKTEAEAIAAFIVEACNSHLTLQARLDEAVALLRGVTYSFVSLSEQSDNNALDLLSIVRKQRNSDLNNAELFLSTLENGGA